MGHGQGQHRGSGHVESTAPYQAPQSVPGIESVVSARDDGVRDARQCQRIAAKHARTFFMASRLLPERKRRAAFAVYATCRTADDIVDAGATRRVEALEALHRFRDDAFRALRRRSDQPILRELSRAWHEFDVPDEPLHELFDGLEQDLHEIEYRTWSALEPYCQAVAGSVGEICCAIFGVADDMSVRGSQTVNGARTLGVAMQLTNILRDVGEDAKRGRCYLPTVELERHGLDRATVLSAKVRSESDAWRAFMQFQIARAHALYRQAMTAIPLLQLDSQRCALACATGYEKILGAIEDAGFDTLSRRVSASRLTLLGVAWRSWRGQFPPVDRTRQAGR
jgi:15-cis-phytoene synthase